MKIGAMTTSFRRPFQESLAAAAALKVDAVQIWATDITYYDPANLTMSGFDAVAGVYALGELIVHTHAKDGMREGARRAEVPLGEGQVDWPRYLKALQDIGYGGYLTIEREVGQDPAADIAAAASFLREQLARL